MVPVLWCRQEKHGLVTNQLITELSIEIGSAADSLRCSKAKKEAGACAPASVASPL
jgi:hypothetical protein